MWWAGQGDLSTGGQEDTLGGGLHHFHRSVIHRVLVLSQPAGDIVGHDTSVVGDSEVSILVNLGLRLQEDREFAQGSLQLLLKGFVGSLGEKGFFFQNGPDTHGLLKHDDSSSQIHAKVHHLPINAFLDILFLFNNKHVELLIDKINGTLTVTDGSGQNGTDWFLHVIFSTDFETISTMTGVDGNISVIGLLYQSLFSGHGGASCSRPSPICLITQMELHDHSAVSHNFETINCTTRDLADVDSNFLANLNRSRKDKLETVEDMEEDLFNDCSVEKSEKVFSTTGQNRSGVKFQDFNQPGPLHISLGKGGNLFKLYILFLFIYELTL